MVTKFKTSRLNCVDKQKFNINLTFFDVFQIVIPSNVWCCNTKHSMGGQFEKRRKTSNLKNVNEKRQKTKTTPLYSQRILEKNVPNFYSGKCFLHEMTV